MSLSSRGGGTNSSNSYRETYDKGGLRSPRPQFNNSLSRAFSSPHHPPSSSSQSSLLAHNKTKIQQTHNSKRFHHSESLRNDTISRGDISKSPRKITTTLVILVCGISGAGKTTLLQKLKQQPIFRTYKNSQMRETIGAREINIFSGDIQRTDHIMQSYKIILKEIGYSKVLREECLNESSEYPICGLIYIIPSDQPDIAGNKEHVALNSHSKDDNDIDENDTMEEYKSKMLEMNRRKGSIKNYFYQLLSKPVLTKIPILILLNTTNPKLNDQNLFDNDRIKSLLNIDKFSLPSMSPDGSIKKKRKIRIMDTTIINDDNISQSMEWILLQVVTYYEKYL